MKQIVKNNWSYILVGIFIFLFAIYVLAYGENIIIPIHDNLDSNIAWVKMISDNHLWWKLHGELPFLGGIDRIYFTSSLKLYSVIYSLLPTFNAFVLCWFLKIIISVGGFVFLGKSIFGNFDENKHVLILSGFLYGLTPTFPSCALSFASLPLILGLLINYYKNNDNKYLIFFLLYPIVSDFSLFGIFILFYMAVYITADWIMKRKIKWSMIYPVILLTLGYIITEYNIFYLMLFSKEQTIRDFFVTEYLSGFKTLKKIYEGFVFSQYHSGSLHNFVVLPTCLIYLGFLIFNNYKNNTLKNIFKLPYVWLMILIVFNSVIYGLDNYYLFKNTMEVILPPLKGFAFSRTLWLNPFLWYFAFAVALCNIFKKLGIRYIIILLALSVFFFGSSKYNFVKDNYRFFRYSIKNKVFSKMTYSQFYSKTLFDKIKNDIKYNGEWSAAYGMHPAILEYNGIATLDGYLSLYSYKYKKEFRKLIEPDLNIDAKHAKYFDNWGARAYLYSKDVKYTQYRNLNQNSAKLYIDPAVFEKMNGKYIFSMVEITNTKDLNLDYINKYEAENSPYKIYVYRFNKSL